MLTDEEFRAFLKTLGARIRSLRKEKGLKLREIMISTGYYDAQWRKYESGGSLNVASLMKIALALNVSLGDLLDGLTQWPMLSVTEIQQRHGLLALLEPEADADVVIEAVRESLRGPAVGGSPANKRAKEQIQPIAAARPTLPVGRRSSSAKLKSPK